MTTPPIEPAPHSYGEGVAEIADVMQQWADAVATLDPDRVLELYHPEHPVLWGTVAAVRRDTLEAVRNYFEHFLARDRIAATFHEPYIRVFGELALASGSYTFEWEDADGAASLTARYSFAYERAAGHWYIVDHHSSALPADGI